MLLLIQSHEPRSSKLSHVNADRMPRGNREQSVGTEEGNTLRKLFVVIYIELRAAVANYKNWSLVEEISASIL